MNVLRNFLNAWRPKPAAGNAGLHCGFTSDSLAPAWLSGSVRRSMSKKRVIRICIATLGVTGLPFCFFHPSPSYDITRVKPRLRSLRQPYQSVKTGYKMDGGSIGIEIVDRDGKREQFALPAHLGDTNRYTRVFVGSLHDRKPGTTEVMDAENTKRMLIQILAATPGRAPYDDFCLVALRRGPSDFVLCLIHKWAGHYQP
jgi:hypothetical protein